MDKISRLSKAMEELIVRMKEIDDRCVEISNNISTREFNLISFVGDQKQVIMRDIAYHLDIPMSTATGIVDKLVSKKYLRRSHSKQDRRSVQIELDKTGKWVYELFMDMKTDMAERILDLLGGEESDKFIELLEKISLGFKTTINNSEAVA